MLKEKNNIKKLGFVGVDSGQLLITDPCYIESEWQKTPEDIDLFSEKNRGKFSYGGCCIATTEEQGGQLNYKLGQPGAGIASRTAYGDGTYPVYAILNKEGRVSKLVVDFEEEEMEKIFDIL